MLQRTSDDRTRERAKQLAYKMELDQQVYGGGSPQGGQRRAPPESMVEDMVARYRVGQPVASTSPLRAAASRYASDDLPSDPKLRQQHYHAEARFCSWWCEHAGERREPDVFRVTVWWRVRGVVLCLCVCVGGGSR
jgi:hypothetical protein